MSELKWRQMTDEERQVAYSPSSCVPNSDISPFLEAYRQRSDASWAELADLGAATNTVRYGNSATQTIDVAVPKAAAAPPLLVFVHGGYWQQLSKVESRFAASDCIRRGWAFAAVDYTLAPTADLPSIVAECQQAVRTLSDQADSLGYDPSRIFVAGSSAGAHLTAMIGLDPDGPTPSVQGAVLVSGVFELAPLIGTSINDAVGIDDAVAAANSPLRADLEPFPATLVAFGSNETDEFKAQSHLMARRITEAAAERAPAAPIEVLEVVGRNHFDVILDLAMPGTVLGDAVARFIDANSSA